MGRMTEAQRRHLNWLAGADTEPPKRSRAGYYCRHNGWSEWLWQMTDGSEATASEVDAMPKPLPDDRCLDRIIGEIITPAGRAALQERDNG